MVLRQNNYCLDTQIQSRRPLLSNMTRCSQSLESIKMEKKVRNAIPNLEVMTKNGTELKHLHNIITCYVNDDREICGCVVKALKFALQKEIDLYYFYDNMRVGIDMMYIVPSLMQ